MSHITVGELTDLIIAALRHAGASADAARDLADATVQAEQVGKPSVGVGHLFDYLDGYRQNRITNAPMSVNSAASSVISVDAQGGLAQSAFRLARAELVQRAHDHGIAALWVSNSYTCGELGFYPRAVATDGMIGLAVANSPALMSVGGAPGRVLGTNPLAFALPRPSGPPIVIDQASSATAYVNIRRSAELGENLPAGWAVTNTGEPTVDPAAALTGALLPFGSYRGGNIALLVEVLATLAGANFSVDAPAFDSGENSPGVGVFLLCINANQFPGAIDRLSTHFDVLQHEHGVSLSPLSPRVMPDTVDVPDDLLERLRTAI